MSYDACTSAGYLCFEVYLFNDPVVDVAISAVIIYAAIKIIVRVVSFITSWLPFV